MALQFAESGGQYHFNGTATGPGLWSAASATLSSGLPTYNLSTYGYGSANSQLTTSNLGAANFTTLFAGFRCYMATAQTAPGPLITFYDISGNEQCSLRINTNGTLFFSRNGTTIGSTSSYQIVYGTWNYIEFKAILSTSGSGTCEARVNTAVQLTATSVTNATTTNQAAAVKFQTQSNTTPAGAADFYVVDTSGSINTSYLGDVTVAEIYPNGAGVNSAWTSNPAASFSLTSVATGTGVYQGTISGGTSNAYQGYYFVVTGFTNGANNGTFLCSASSTTSLTLVNASSVSETHAGTAAFQSIPQIGIHGGIVDGYATTNVGTRPNGDVAYMSDLTANDKTDYAHQALSLTGTIAGVVHVTYARKDDAGTRQIQQMCLSAGTEEDSATISLSTSYTYYQDILEKDPHTSAAWTLSNLNAATFGWREIT